MAGATWDLSLDAVADHHSPFLVEMERLELSK